MGKVYHVGEYGVQPARALQTAAIQRVVDLCAREGGGTVAFADGRYTIAGLWLRSGVTLSLSGGTRLVGSENMGDYVDHHVPSSLQYLQNERVIKEWNLPGHYIMAPIVAFEAENVGIVGEKGSVIDGVDCFDPAGEERFRGPHGMVFSHCRGVTLTGYTVERSANWAHQIDACENVVLSNVTVLGGHDGVNVHHCKNVLIENCVFRTGDDCVAGYDVRGLTVRKCLLNTSCSAFRIGGRDILVEDCDFRGVGEYPHRVSGRHNSLFAFLYYAIFCDEYAGPSQNWLIRNCRIRDYDGFFFYDRVNEEMMHSGAPLTDVRFEAVTVTGLAGPATVRCAPGETLSMRFTDCSFAFRAGVQAAGPLRGLEGVRVEGEFYRKETVEQENMQK